MMQNQSSRETRISTGFGKSIPARSGGGTTVAPYFADRQYFLTAFKAPKPEAAYGFTTPRYEDVSKKPDHSQLITTGRNMGFGTEDVMDPDITDDRTPKKKGVFRCKDMPTMSSSPQEATSVDAFGTANKYLKRITLKLFNFTACPNEILHGIVYLNVSQIMQVNSIGLEVNGITRKEKTMRGTEITETSSGVFSTNAISSTDSEDFRSIKTYKAPTENYSGKDVYSRLKLTSVLPWNDPQLEQFGGPIKLEPGCHAIPFAMRVPENSLPSFRIYEEVLKKNMGKELFENKYRLKATLHVMGTPGDEDITLTTKTVPVHIYSCGCVPSVIDDIYAPGFVQKIDLSYKKSQVLLIFDRVHLTFDDVIRIHLFSNNLKAAQTACMELYLTTNLPDIGLVDSQKEPGLKLISRSKVTSFEKSFGKKYTSRVGEKYPIKKGSDSSYDHDNQDIDANAGMPENERVSGCLIELPVIKNLQPSLNVDGASLVYFVRTSISVKNDRKLTVARTEVYVHDRLLQNCSS